MPKNETVVLVPLLSAETHAYLASCGCRMVRTWRDEAEAVVMHFPGNDDIEWDSEKDRAAVGIIADIAACHQLPAEDFWSLLCVGVG